MINHPLTETLRTKLDIPYNFYIEGFMDMKDLLEARGFKENEAGLFDDDDFVSEWVKTANKKMYILKIADSLFDEDKKLKFIKRTDWQDKFVEISEAEESEDDDLPF